MTDPEPPSTATDTPPAKDVTPSASASEAATPSPEMVLQHRAVRAVVAALTAGGHAPTMRVMPDTAPTAAAAAAQLGCGVGAIANSLVFEAGGEPLLVLTSGVHRVDPKALGPRIGLSRSAIKRAKPDMVKNTTGQAIGGVAPVGHKVKLRTLVDEELRNYPVVWAAGGHHMVVYATTFDELVKVTGGEVVKVD